MSERDAILREVLNVGFDRVGCLPLRDAGDPKILEWIARGHHGAMDYLERHAHAKADPTGAFPEYRSILVCALEYGDVADAPPSSRTGNISRYALGDDYHVVLKRRLFEAADRLRTAFPGLATKAFVDTGPINEKLVAARSGLGWVGRNTNLIDATRGSYLFLGLLLVSAELAATGPPEKDRCGICNDCIPACPTGAIIAPYVLDARRCISYLTIELRGSIPRDLRPKIGNRIFGCDDCQEVCPWNRFARQETPEPFRPREGFRDGDLTTWLGLSSEDFARKFRHSAVKRARYVGFLRNVLVSAGCSGDPSLAKDITPHLAHPEPMVREHAAWALGKVLGLKSQPILETHLLTETSDSVRVEIIATLKEITSVG